MKTYVLLAVLFAMCCFPAIMFAQQASPPKPPVELDQLKSLLITRNSNCKGKEFATQFGPERVTRLILISTLDLDGFWYVVQGAEKKTAANPNPVKFRSAFGYDTASKKFITLGVDNLGGHNMQTADAVSGGKAVFTGTYKLNGTDYTVRDSYTATTHLGEMQVGGDWKKVDEETCTAR